MNIIILKHKHSCIQAESPIACLKNVSYYDNLFLHSYITLLLKLDNTIMGTEENSNYKQEGHNVAEWLRAQALELRHVLEIISHVTLDK